MDVFLEDLHKNLKANLEQADSAETILSQKLNTDPEHILQSVVNEMKEVPISKREGGGRNWD